MVGRQLVQARAVLERAGFQVEETRVRSEADFDQVLEQDPNPGEEAEEGSTVVLEVSGGPGTVLVPTVRNLPQAQAIDELEERGLRANVDRLSSEEVRAGLALRTVPSAGTEVERGERIQLFISSGPELVAVPGVIGLSRDSAESQISAAGLVPAVQEQESEEPEGEVIGQDPGRGGRAAPRVHGHHHRLHGHRAGGGARRGRDRRRRRGGPAERRGPRARAARERGRPTRPRTAR